MPTTTPITRETPTTRATAREQLLADRRAQMREDPYVYFASARRRAKRQATKLTLRSPWRPALTR